MTCHSKFPFCFAPSSLIIDSRISANAKIAYLSLQLSKELDDSLIEEIQELESFGWVIKGNDGSYTVKSNPINDYKIKPSNVASNKSRQEKREERSKDFYNKLSSYIEYYPKELLRAFYNYWSEPNPSGTKMRFELEKTWDLSRRLSTWASNENKFTPKPQKETITGSPPLKTPEQIFAERKAKQDARIFKETH